MKVEKIEPTTINAVLNTTGYSMFGINLSPKSTAVSKPKLITKKVKFPYDAYKTAGFGRDSTGAWTSLFVKRPW